MLIHCDVTSAFKIHTPVPDHTASSKLLRLIFATLPNDNVQGSRDDSRCPKNLPALRTFLYS